MAFKPKIVFLLVSIILIIPFQETNAQAVPEQVQKFLQSTFLNPIKERVKEGVQGISGIISHYSNPDAPNSGDNNDDTENSSSRSTEIPIKQSTTTTEVPKQNEDMQVAESNSTDSPTGTFNNSRSGIDIRLQNPDQETVTSGPPVQQSSTVSSTETPEDYLSQDALMQMRKLCPELESHPDGSVMLYRYFEEKNKCFRVKFTGPCGKGMKVFIKEKGSIHGQCECTTAKVRFHIYHEESNACYPIFTQGYCPEGEWVDLTPEGRPICTENPCASNNTNKGDFVFLKGKCAEVETHDPEICAPNASVGFKINRRTPVCSPQQDVITGGITPCQPGNSIAIHGKCHVSEWEFGDEEPKEETKNSN